MYMNDINDINKKRINRILKLIKRNCPVGFNIVTLTSNISNINDEVKLTFICNDIELPVMFYIYDENFYSENGNIIHNNDIVELVINQIINKSSSSKHNYSFKIV